jgi:hypothetical protein
MRLKVLLTVVFLLFASCAKKNSVASKAQVSPQTDLNTDLNAASDSELLGHIGEKVTMHGKFSLRGKIGPYILVTNGPIYVVPQGSFSWGDNYARMEGQDVRVTGILRYAHYANANGGPSSEQRPHDHFYFQAETAKIELNGNLQ